MPMTYCSCITRGQIAHLVPDPGRVGFYICSGCGAPEEVVNRTYEEVQMQYTRTGEGFGRIPESLLSDVKIVTNPDGSLRADPYKDPAIEFKGHSGLSLKEIEAIGQEINGG